MIDTLGATFARDAAGFDAWIAARLDGLVAPFYSSADIRDSGAKAACVDMNLFPAGFNNICESFAARAIAPIRNALLRCFDGRPYQRVLIVPEAHSRNPYYNSHLSSLRALLRNAGLDVAIAAMPDDDGRVPAELVTFDEQRIEVVPVRREDARIVDAQGAVFDWILLNNDLSSGPIPWLEGLEQQVLPPPCLGWHKRSKHQFFMFYNAVVQELAADYQFDPWLLSPATDKVANVTFETDEGRGRVAAAVKTMLDAIGRKYAEHGIADQPHVFVKNDAGTYGMGIMVVSSPDEVVGMNRKERNKMAVGKGRAPVRAVVVQEAVPTRTITADSVAEPVVYLFGAEVIGAFLRANAERGAVDNLNAKGMTFYRYCDLHPARRPAECVCTDTRQAFYHVIAKVAVVAAAREHAVVCGKPATA